jgi:hypothetical protein
VRECTQRIGNDWHGGLKDLEELCAVPKMIRHEVPEHVQCKNAIGPRNKRGMVRRGSGLLAPFIVEQILERSVALGAP